MSIKWRPRPIATQEPTRRETRVRDALLVALTVSTGAVDAISFLGLGKVFSAFMTGNLVFLGSRAGGAAGPPIPHVLTAVTAFAAGAVLAARVVRPTQDDGDVWPRRVTLALTATLVVQAAFLGVWWSVAGHPSNEASMLLIALSALAMGTQTAAISSLAVRGVFTTAATATLAFFMGDLTGWSQPRGERLRLSAVIVGLLAGALIGGVLVVHAVAWAPLFPLGMTAVVVTAAALSFRDSVAEPSDYGHSSPQAFPHSRSLGHEMAGGPADANDGQGRWSQQRTADSEVEAMATTSSTNKNGTVSGTPGLTDGFNLVVYKGDEVNHESSDPAPTLLLHSSRYEQLIQAFGGNGYYAEDTNSLTASMQKALADGRPAVINCLIDPTAGTESGHLQNLNADRSVSPTK